MTIEFYKEFGELGYLANYSNHGFVKNGIYYKTVEHYYQSEKFDNLEIKKKIIDASSPKEASNIGRDRNNIRIHNFKKIKNQVMYEGILEKFRQNREIAYKLIETKDATIAEATVDEYYWGIGADKTGKNNIGKILVKVREKIKRELLESIIEKARIKGEVYVIGHRLADADSIFSSYILSKILNKMGIKAYFACLENNNYCRNDLKLIKDYLKEEPLIIDETEGKYFILVDHNNLDGLKNNQVLGAIDHHIITNEVYDTLEMEYASTSLLLYDLFKELYEFSDYEKQLIGLTVLQDTEYLCSSRYGRLDKKLFLELNLNLDVLELQNKYFTINDFSLGILKNLEDNYKEYYRNGFLIKRSLIYSYKKEYDLYFSLYKEYIDSLDDKRLLIWCDYESKKTLVYFNKKVIKFDYILTSTNLILDDLMNKGILF